MTGSRDRGRDRGIEARCRGETEAFENSFEARPRRDVGRPRGGLETEAPRPRPQPYLLLLYFVIFFSVLRYKVTAFVSALKNLCYLILNIIL